MEQEHPKSEAFPVKRTAEAAIEEFLKKATPEEKEWVVKELLGNNMQNAPEHWNKKVANGVRFFAVPKNLAEIRKALGIKEEHTVLVGPVFSGEWSSVHKNAVGIDFSDEALKKHPNGNRILADLRKIPLPDGHADHFVSFEPTPLHAGTATPWDVLQTLKEMIRVADNVHIVQRSKGKNPALERAVSHKVSGQRKNPVQDCRYLTTYRTHRRQVQKTELWHGFAEHRR